MRKSLTAAIAALSFASAAPVAAQVVTPNSSGPTSPISASNTGWGYGSGNNYQPSNTLLLDAGGWDQLALRFHETFQQAPASDANGVYNFALGTDPISFDWDISAWNHGYDYATITASNLLTGQSFSYNPYCPLIVVCVNDNFVYGGTAQNSNRLNYLPIGFDANVNNTYSVNITTYLGNTVQNSLTAYAQVGSGYLGATAAVPEPATWAMMLFGFGGIGLAMRSRRRSALVKRLA